MAIDSFDVQKVMNRESFSNNTIQLTSKGLIFYSVFS